MRTQTMNIESPPISEHRKAYLRCHPVAAYRYSIGLDPPHYPVPAIRFGINYGQIYVSIWDLSWQSQHWDKHWYPVRTMR